MRTKYLGICLLIVVFTGCAKGDKTPKEPNQPQKETMYVSGKDLILSTGEKIILRGINYPTIDAGRIDNIAEVHQHIDEAAKTGANAIRFTWYTNGVHFWDGNAGGPGTVDGWVSDGSLQNMLAYAHQKGMIPILELHDPSLYDNQGNLIEERITCSNNYDYFNSVVGNWWKSSSVQALIEQSKSYLIINLANEFGQVRFTNQPNALLTFKTNYLKLISDLRALGVKVPIMIDAPDCGTSSSELLSIAEEMQNSDSEHNLIFSAHAYWYEYAPTQTIINQKLEEARSKNICFIIGEVANTQDVNGCGSADITQIAQYILEKACSEKIGWLAWTFDQDCSPQRKITKNGQFSNLTLWGEIVVNNPNYGLKSSEGCGGQ